MHAIGWLAVAIQQAGNRLEILAGERELTRSMDLGMAGKYLFDQGRAGPRQPDDEHGPLRVEPGSREPREEGRIERRDQTRNQVLVLVRLIGSVSSFELAHEPVHWLLEHNRRPAE